MNDPRISLGRILILACLSFGFASALSAKGNVSVSVGVQLPRGAVSVNVGKERYYQLRGVYYR